MSRHQRPGLTVLAIAVCIVAACSRLSDERKPPTPHAVEIRLVQGLRTDLTREIVIGSSRGAGRRFSEPAAVEIPKMEPQVRALLEAAGMESLVDVVIGIKPQAPIPPLAALDPREPRTSPKNQKLLAGRRQILAQERINRLAAQAPYVEQILSAGGQILDQHTLCNCFAAKVPARLLVQLAEDPGVRHVDPVETNTPPPEGNSVADGRRIIGSDPYFGLIVSPADFRNYIGLLDTGVRASHSLYNLPDRIASLRDCTFGGDNCEDVGDPRFNPLDTFWNHGTSTGAIISGNENLGDPSRGITYLNIDSWKVYPASMGLNINSAIKAFNAAIFSGDGILVAEMQANTTSASNLAMASNDAFDSGSAIIAANGNYGPQPRTVAGPANAQKAIGVGAFDIVTLVQQGYQSRGPTEDNRIKPDLQAPTNSVTASAMSDTALHSFGGTSGATPYASGAASSLRNWYVAQALCPPDDCPPGLIYAGLLMFGSKFGPLEWNNTEGTGKTHLGAIDPTCSHWLIGSATVASEGTTIDVPFSADSAVDADFRTALWWPDAMDGSTLIHNEIDLYVLDPSGSGVANSVSENSVFENAFVPGPMASGQWRVRMVGARIRDSQTVYYAAYAGGSQACP